MLRKLSATLLVPALLLGAGALASDFAYPVANESGTAYRNPEYALRDGALVRVDDLAGPSTSARDLASARGEFIYRGDGVGWEITPHDFVVAGSRLAHSDRCDHRMHTAVAPAASEVDAMRMMSPG